MARSSTSVAAIAVARLHNVIDRPPAIRPRHRSWFFRFFLAPFIDMDHRAVYLIEKRRDG